MSANLTAPPSPTSFSRRRSQRLQSAWRYKGPDAAKTPGITPDQLSYAITLRRQLAERLLAGALWSVSEIGLIHAEWACIKTALRREITRCNRAHLRLARKKAVAA